MNTLDFTSPDTNPDSEQGKKDARFTDWYGISPHGITQRSVVSKYRTWLDMTTELLEMSSLQANGIKVNPAVFVKLMDAAIEVFGEPVKAATVVALLRNFMALSNEIRPAFSQYTVTSQAMKDAMIAIRDEFGEDATCERYINIVVAIKHSVDPPNGHYDRGFLVSGYSGLWDEFGLDSLNHAIRLVRLGLPFNGISELIRNDVDYETVLATVVGGSID